MSASLTPIYGEAAPKSRTRDLPLMGEDTCHRTKDRKEGSTEPYNSIRKYQEHIISREGDHLQLLQASKGKEVISEVSHLKISSHVPMVDSGNQKVQQECNPQPRMDLGNSNSKRGQSPRRWT
ncbi:hypothetical protein DVH24_035835 [Malus domestica]|uniref:Uncharacterized protein n=1 Tax=Malus domestica TaxID=3750 RepID=A0A498JQH3_MALDO|nr:hypothetical protein DVH24_035835 [Malus domestica]